MPNTAVQEAENQEIDRINERLAADRNLNKNRIILPKKNVYYAQMF